MLPFPVTQATVMPEVIGQGQGGEYMVTSKKSESLLMYMEEIFHLLN